MRYTRLYSYQEARYILQGMAFWENDIGQQARRLLYWYNKNWIDKKDLKQLVHGLLENAAAENLLSDRDVIRMVIREQMLVLAETAKKQSNLEDKEELLALYMLTAKENKVDVEHAIFLYLQFKEEHEIELNEWREKCQHKPKRRKHKKFVSYGRRNALMNKRKALVERRQRLKLENWIKEKEVSRVWAEERKDLFRLLDLKDNDNANNQD